MIGNTYGNAKNSLEIRQEGKVVLFLGSWIGRDTV
jgi:hypothetical protein